MPRHRPKIALFHIWRPSLGLSREYYQTTNSKEAVRMPKSTANRLAKEKSPYLLQHAYNPVDWYPWGEEAFNEARRRDVPIFLSIGYSTCHWCHVMERESFEDEEVADVLNEAFVCVKVDREERPDLDAYYMAVCQALTGSGGWPLTVILTPEKQPFYAGTYFPKESRSGRPGLLDLAPALQQAWQTKRERLLEAAREVQAHLERGAVLAHDTQALQLSTLEQAEEQLLRSFDAEYGGFGRPPKFPTPHTLTFLLRYWRRTGLKQPLQAVLYTLRQMGRGGIYDHVGFGFHRYSTDRQWLLPHFEKMLYDQAMLAVAFLEAYQATGEEDLAEKAREVFTYVLRDLTSPEEAFYSAEDADSEGVEGRFYVWSLAELQQHLSEAAFSWVKRVFGLREEGNFRDEASGETVGSNILHLIRPWCEWADEVRLSESELRQRWSAIRERLLQVREQRVRPYRDDKVLTDWNGLMIAALAYGGRVLGDSRWTEAARKAMDFLLTRLRRPDGRLWKRFREGEAALPAHLDDYAFTVWALLELHQTTQQPEYLRLALELNQLTLQLFQDEEQGGFYLTAEDETELPVRMKETYDGAIPAGNSIATLNNLRLARLTGNEDLSRVAERSWSAMGRDLSAHPTAYTQMLQALDFHLGPTHEVVVVGKEQDPGTRAMLTALASWYQPRQVALFKPADEDNPPIAELAPFVAAHRPMDDRPTAYVCSGFSCRKPTTDIQEMLAQLGR
jgi:uncharacterized protein YyaL (SSP411 family)